MKNALFSVLLIIFSFEAHAEIPFSLDWKLDSPIFLIALSETALSLTLPKALDYGELENKKGDLSSVPAFDRWTAHNYKKSFDIAGDATLALSLALPAAVYSASYFSKKIDFSDAFTLAVLYAESFFLTQGTCGLLKLAAKRDRPFLYYDEWDSGALTDGDAHFSFPSSHTADAFMSAAFLSYTFPRVFPDSNLQIPVIAGSYAIAFAVGAFRIASANHFPTDVLAGGAIGTLFGFAVPFVHSILFEKKSQKTPELSLTPFGFFARVHF